MDRERFKRYILVSTMSATAIAVQIALVRVFSVIFWYHFTFMILSIALLGFGYGGLIVTKYQRVLKNYNSDKLVCSASVVCGILLVFTLFFITNNPCHSINPSDSSKTIILFSIFEFFTDSIALLLLFAVFGAIILFILQSRDRAFNRYYAANLGGSALGCFLSVSLLNVAGGINTVMILGILIELAAILFAGGKFKFYSRSAVFLAILFFCSLPFTERIFPLRALQGKPVLQVKEKDFIYKDWNSLSKLDIFKHHRQKDDYFGLWGLSPQNTSPVPERLGMLIDYLSYSTILKHNDGKGYYDFLKNLPAYFVYDLGPENPEVLIIGPGGGMDLRAALVNKAEKIDAVEINPSVVKAMTNQFAEYSGHLYDHPCITIHSDDGRHFVERSEKNYDIIQLSAVETFCASQSGAFNLNENYLFTKEAFEHYFDHLKPGGILTASRWYTPSANNYPRFTMRLFTLAFEALRAKGVKEPAKNILLYTSENFAVLLARLTPFSPDEINRIDNTGLKKNIRFLYRPDKILFTAMKFYSYVKAENKKEWIEEYPFNVSPPGDDKPFYFENRKLKRLFSDGDYNAGYTMFDGQTILVMLFLIMLVALLLLSLFSWRIQHGQREIAGWFYFFSTGMGFMLAEITFARQLILPLGHPVYALTVVMFSFLLFAGAGSFFSERVSKKMPIHNSLLILAGILLIQACTGNRLIPEITGLSSFISRMIISVLFLAPAAFFMGFTFPEGIKKFSGNNQNSSTGIFWAWNCTASVFASVIAVLAAIEFGFQAVLMIAAFSYLAPGLHLLAARPKA